MSGDARAGAAVYGGLGLVALATLTYEILLTRIFSVTMWYHFAFVAISLAMFGMSAGALAVYLWPARFPAERVRHALAASALLFALTIVASLVLHLQLPLEAGITLAGLPALVLTYVIVSVPFFFSGVCVCLALTRFPGEVGALYGADLAGAAAGCLAVGLLLRVTDGLTAVLAVAAVAAAGGALFATSAGARGLLRANAAAATALALLSGVHTGLVQRDAPWFRIRWAKGALQQNILYEKWNPFSRITVHGDLQAVSRPFGWGLSPSYDANSWVRQLMLMIDASAGTILTGWDGTAQSVQYLAYDLTNLVHHVRTGGDVLVLGAGGGRDLLAALGAGHRSVVGVELNGATIEAAYEKFADYTGHLARDPRVRLVHDEARSWLERHDERFDVIQLSLTDTWAATAAGAYVLGENSLYTVEAWKLYLERLEQDGLVSCSRWYFRDQPGEIWRLVALAATALRQLGADDPLQHMLLVRVMHPDDDSRDGLGTLLVGRSPLAEHDVAAAERVAERMGFEVVLSPRGSDDSALAGLASGRDLDGVAASLPLDVTPPTDDRPFFFQMLRPGDVFHTAPRSEIARVNLQAVSVLVGLAAAIAALTAACMLLPLAALRRAALSREALWPLAYFAAIGSGFMLIEISQMQRLTVFLGHPTYGLSVVLFALLLSGGLGSWLVQQVEPAQVARAGRRRLGLLLGVAALFGLATPWAVGLLAGAPTAVRVVAAATLLVPLGTCLGMGFPLGMKLAGARWPGLTAWFWGVNGATSVCASVLAVIVALGWGISRAFWAGCACYGVALAAYWAIGRKPAA